MKYVRFQSRQPLPRTNTKLGIFQSAFRVRDAETTSEYDRYLITRNLEWLLMHLQSPAVLNDETNYRALSWFKDTAREPLKRIWALRPHLETYGYWIDVVKTHKPGSIIYEDAWQVAAKTWRNAKR